MASFSASENNVPEIAQQTLKNVQSRFEDIERDKGVQAALSDALIFMSGDKSYEFSFEKLTGDLPMSLFDQGQFTIVPDKPTSVVLFSGGLDSLTGVVDRLKNTNDNICLMSHQSGQPESVRTQRKLVEALNERYGNRCNHFKFFCNLKGDRARLREEKKYGYIPPTNGNGFTLISEVETIKGSRKYRYKCDKSGREFINTRRHYTTKKHTTACCVQKLNQRKKTQLEKTWDRIKSDSEWESFEEFKKDVGDRKGRGLIKVWRDKPYSKDNHQWAGHPRAKEEERKYIGVYYNNRGNSWQAKIRLKGRRYINVGRYDTQSEAAIARNEYIIKNNLTNPLQNITN